MAHLFQARVKGGNMKRIPPSSAPIDWRPRIYLTQGDVPLRQAQRSLLSSPPPLKNNYQRRFCLLLSLFGHHVYPVDAQANFDSEEHGLFAVESVRIKLRTAISIMYVCMYDSDPMCY